MAILPLPGGLGGFGLELADWLVLRGAHKLVLVSRTGIRTGYQSLRVRIWRSNGVEVVISLADITTKSGVTALLADANKLGQVDAIFNLAVVSAELVLSYEAHHNGETMTYRYILKSETIILKQLVLLLLFLQSECMPVINKEALRQNLIHLLDQKVTAILISLSHHFYDTHFKLMFIKYAEETSSRRASRKYSISEVHMQ